MKNIYHVGLSHFFKIGSKHLSKGLESFHTVERFYNASAKELTPVLGEKLAQEFIAFRDTFPLQKKVDEIQRKRIEIVTREDPRMPKQLQQIPDPPFCLYVKGELSRSVLECGHCFAIVGTRRASTYGRQVTTLFSRTLAQAGITIVSGMALGIDSTAHIGCLDAHGKTIAVLGCGVDIIYPTGNRLLYQRIIDSGGLIMSEFPPGYMPRPYTFIMRNRLISGLGKGVLVVEGTMKSGSMITAGYAAEQGRDLYAVPMPITSERAAGPNYLLRHGARLVTDPSEILEDYGMSPVTVSALIKVDLTAAEEKITSMLKENAMTNQELVEITRQPVQALLSDLSSLELKGIIVKNKEGKYEVKL